MFGLYFYTSPIVETNEISFLFPGFFFFTLILIGNIYSQPFLLFLTLFHFHLSFLSLSLLRMHTHFPLRLLSFFLLSLFYSVMHPRKS